MVIKLNGLSHKEQDDLLVKDMIFLGYRGSIAHGMYLPNTDPNSIDDKDIIGLYMAEFSHYIGVIKQKEVVEKFYNEWDCVYYEFLKLINMLIKGNPNVLMLLWLEDKHILHKSEFWNMILDIRDAFVCKNVYHSFCGYAHSQFHKMTSFNKQGFMGEKRKKLVEKYGYDCKNASHLIRLLKMGMEFLTEGRLYVERKSDASQLLDIKRGNWTLDEVKTEAKKLFALCEEAYVRCSLPQEVNLNIINDTCVAILKKYLANNPENATFIK